MPVGTSALMDPLSSVMLRAALTWLLVGVVIGAAMLTDRALPEAVAAVDGAEPRAYAVRGGFFRLPSALRTGCCPTAGRGATAGLPRTGRVSRGPAPQPPFRAEVIVEPVRRTGYECPNTPAFHRLGAPAGRAAVVFVIQLWPRVGRARCAGTVNSLPDPQAQHETVGPNVLGILADLCTLS